MAKKAAKKIEKPPVNKKVAAKKETKPAEKEKATPLVEEPQKTKKLVDQTSGGNIVDCPEPELGSTEFDEMTIKEIMVQKNVNRIGAINILRNPS